MIFIILINLKLLVSVEVSNTEPKGFVESNRIEYLSSLGPSKILEQTIGAFE